MEWIGQNFELGWKIRGVVSIYPRDQVDSNGCEDYPGESKGYVISGKNEELKVV